jgi:hypothetical protein
LALVERVAQQVVVMRPVVGLLILEHLPLITYPLLVVDMARLEQLQPTQKAVVAVAVLAVLGIMHPLFLARAVFHPLYIGAAHLTQII